MRSCMAQVDIEGTRFEYHENGSGEPVVFVHGSASDHRTWRFQRDVFAEQFRTITYSRRYHWPNEPIHDGVDYAMAEHVDDLQKVIRSLDATPAHLVGHSYGAFLCLLLAMRAPDLVRTLILAEPPVITLFVSNTPKPLELLKLLVTRPRTAAAIIKFGATGVAPASKAFQKGDMEAGVRAFGDAVFGSGGYDRLPEPRKEQVQDNLSNVKAELLGSGFVPLDGEQVQRVQVPTLLVTGEHSIGLFHRLMDRLGELLPHAERIEIPGASHMMHEDNASEYNAAVFSFISRHSQAV
ncbi:MAG TPA: alpha/beta hydrolase [Rhodothermales bacterium]|nr:alpha/beta hydrolase [Rhodothermales bacterium]